MSLFRYSVAAMLLAGFTQTTHAETPDRSIALIIDASGSMKARLDNGQARIDAAKDAVEALVRGLPDRQRLALWAYGHQSPTKARNCRDTQLLSSFQPIGDNRAEVLRLSRELKPQGYTPITLVLEQAANGLKPETASPSRVVILVSDGKETCEGDPCAVARALAKADSGLVVHTIGFAVDVAARYQLQCIARVGRGTYFEADTTPRLVERLSAAVKTVAITVPAEIKTQSKKPGTLRLASPSASRHEVISVETGKTITKLSAVTSSVELPAGFYNVKFGNQLWRSIEVRDGEATVIETAIVELPTASFKGHDIRDWETGEVVGTLSSSKASMNLMPSSYTLSFGNISVPFTLEPGKRKIIEAVSVSFAGLPINSRMIYDEAGKEVIDVSLMRSSATLPPGRYVLDLLKTKVPFELKLGEEPHIELE
ncbi:MAG: VWA domain-containing protein [Hyphomicrobiaceae bacterium]|nr:MAG: VWA domain-containing protein [Hyphomicrobiaceae bacterium]